MKKIVSAILSFLIFTDLAAQSDPIQQYIETYKGLAMEEMKRTGVPASIKLAQGILESEAGESRLARIGNNHFGIKCKSNWTGETMHHDDDERGECFRKYESPEQSFMDHSDFLKSSSRYSYLFSLDPSDYRKWSQGLKKAGYATDPNYPQRLIRNIEKYDLQQYTLMVLEESGSDVAYNKDAGSDTAPTEEGSNSSSAVKKTYDFGKKTEYNGLKAVYAARGTSLLALANRFKLPLSRMMEYNDLGSDGILPEDQWVYLEKKWKEGKTEYYVLGEGEDLQHVSRATGVQLPLLIHYNSHLQESDMVPGTRVFLKDGRQNNGNALNKDKAVIHEVKPKEGLYSISRMYNVSVDELKALNNLTEETLRVGQQLIISN